MGYFHRVNTESSSWKNRKNHFLITRKSFFPPVTCVGTWSDPIYDSSSSFELRWEKKNSRTRRMNIIIQYFIVLQVDINSIWTLFFLLYQCWSQVSTGTECQMRRERERALHILKLIGSTLVCGGFAILFVADCDSLISRAHTKEIQLCWALTLLILYILECTEVAFAVVRP